MNHTKIQYALIAHRETLEANRRVDQWQHHFIERLASLDDDEIDEFKKGGGVIGAGSSRSQGRTSVNQGFLAEKLGYTPSGSQQPASRVIG